MVKYIGIGYTVLSLANNWLMMKPLFCFFWTCPRTQAKHLSELKPGDGATVAGLDAKGAMRQRLLEMGFTKGTAIKVEKYAPMGDPIEIVVKGYHLSLRKEDCQRVLVVREP